MHLPKARVYASRQPILSRQIRFLKVALVWLRCEIESRIAEADSFDQVRERLRPFLVCYERLCPVFLGRLDRSIELHGDRLRIRPHLIVAQRASALQRQKMWDVEASYIVIGDFFRLSEIMPLEISNAYMRAELGSRSMLEFALIPDDQKRSHSRTHPSDPPSVARFHGFAAAYAAFL